MSGEQSAAWPIADQALTQNILDLIQQASHMDECGDTSALSTHEQALQTHDHYAR
ncbi:MAG: hypothetical protein Q9172_001623 [Xanthocarpia lactea]